jgi:glycosyltransferase involved in cell wall biosynthesis
MKKKVLFMVINMNVGGTEKALLNMIDKMPEDKYDLTVLMLEKYGGFLNAIPKRVNVEYLDGYREIKEILNNPPKTVVLNVFKDLRFFKAIYLIFLFLLSAIYKERSILFNSLLRDMKITQNEYDVAIAYAGPMDFISFFIAKKVNAKKKFQWIHFDVGKIHFNIYFASKIYPLFDKIFVVSDQAKEKLIELLPSIKNKTEKFHNIVDSSKVKRMADEGVGFSDNFNGIRILTVGRLSKEKGQDLTIPVLAKLKEEGFNVRWYCIGEGTARKEYERMIEELGIENDYILLGSNPNPYPFMSQCDLYIQPSRHEGYCITLAEARCFNKPIICTDFTGAQEQLNHIQNGKIVNFNETALLNEIINEIQVLKKNRVSKAESFANIK